MTSPYPCEEHGRDDARATLRFDQSLQGTQTASAIRYQGGTWHDVGFTSIQGEARTGVTR